MNRYNITGPVSNIQSSITAGLEMTYLAGIPQQMKAQKQAYDSLKNTQKEIDFQKSVVEQRKDYLNEKGKMDYKESLDKLEELQNKYKDIYANAQDKGIIDPKYDKNHKDYLTFLKEGSPNTESGLLKEISNIFSKKVDTEADKGLKDIDEFEKKTGIKIPDSSYDTASKDLKDLAKKEANEEKRRKQVEAEKAKVEAERAKYAAFEKEVLNK
jgi:hypothetical protein